MSNGVPCSPAGATASGGVRHDADGARCGASDPPQARADGDRQALGLDALVASLVTLAPAARGPGRWRRASSSPRRRWRPGCSGTGRPDRPAPPAAAERPWETMEQSLDRSGSFTVVSNYGTGGNPKARGRRRSCEPSATVTGKIRRNRLTGPGGLTSDRFTLAEAGRLQTFPIDYPWSGRDVAQQIGNAIPPRLAAHVLAAELDLPISSDVLDVTVASSWRGPSTADANPQTSVESDPCAGAFPTTG